MAESKDYVGSSENNRRDKEYHRSGENVVTINVNENFNNRKENGDIGERTFEDYDVELINPPMLRLREDLSVQDIFYPALYRVL